METLDLETANKEFDKNVRYKYSVLYEYSALYEWIFRKVHIALAELNSVCTVRSVVH